jgi:hypothetical protein
MVQGILVWLITLLLSYFIIGGWQQRDKRLDSRFMTFLFFYHSLLAIVYYLYALFNPSDSRGYFGRAFNKIRGEEWLDYFGVSTTFIDFVSFFFVNRLGFTYEACMAIFSWFGFLGFLYFYILFQERIKSRPTLYGFDAIRIIFLLPNLHFWSSSLGKGSLIFLGFGLFFYAIGKPGVRIAALILGGWIIFQIRPHIFYVILIAMGLAYTFSTKGVAIGYRIAILLVAGFLLVYINEDIVKLTGLEDEPLFDPLLSHRARELTKATSGIDITNYSIPEKLFAFWFRPLFFDAPGVLGIIISFENVFYLIFFLRLIRPKGFKFIFSSDVIVKTSLFTFLGVSFALAQISGNLGLAMRQKSQVMILVLFVILKFMDEQRILQIRNIMARKEMQKRLRTQASGSESQD